MSRSTSGSAEHGWIDNSPDRSRSEPWQQPYQCLACAVPTSSHQPTNPEKRAGCSPSVIPRLRSAREVQDRCVAIEVVPLPTKPVREIAPAHVLDGQQDLLKVPPVIEFVPRIHDGVQCVLIGVQQRLAGPSGVLKDPVAQAGASPAREVHHQYAAVEVGPLLLTSPAGPTLLAGSEPVVPHRGDWCFAKCDPEERREVSPDQDVRVQIHSSLDVPG